MFMLSPADGYRGISAVDKSVHSYFASPEAEPPRIEVQWNENELQRPISDHPDFDVRALCFSASAELVLNPFLAVSCKRIPLYGLGSTYVVFIVHRIVDALDRAQSRLVEAVPGTVSLIRSPALRSAQCAGEHVFRVPEHRSHFFVSSAFVEAVRRRDLVGFDFQPCLMI